MHSRSPQWFRWAVIGTVGVIPLSLLSLEPAQAATSNVNVVGYSVVGPAYKTLETDFQATAAGSGITFTNSFGASDTETNDVVAGLPADIVNLSYAPNMSTLVAASKVPVNWALQERTVAGVNVNLTGKRQQTVFHTPGIVTDSVVVFAVRAGNPLNIKNWGDLVKPGVQIVTPNPVTSGSARWNLLAAYASQIALKRTPGEADAFLKALISNTIAQPTSGSAALAAFIGGTGNVLLDYEDDVDAAIAAGDNIQLVTPPETLLIENPIALTNTGVSNPAAVAFYKYLFSKAGQTVLAGLGYRSVLKSVWTKTDKKFGSFRNSTALETVEQLSPTGWATLNPEFFNNSVIFPSGGGTYPNFGIVTYLEKFAGSTA
jgi:sulfate/thiosulfate transport system substrate-binding protein